MKKIYFLLVALILGITLDAQELAYNNNISDFLQLNPAFAGSKGVYRATINNQLRWYGAIHNTFYNSFSFDMNYKKLPRLGLGIQAQYNQLSTGFVHSVAALSVSYRLGMLRKFVFIPALRFSYKGYYLNTNDLIFYDQLSVYDGIYTRSAAVLEVHNFHLLNISAGFVAQFPINFNTIMPAWVNFGLVNNIRRYSSEDILTESVNSCSSLARVVFPEPGNPINKCSVVGTVYIIHHTGLDCGSIKII